MNSVERQELEELLLASMKMVNLPCLRMGAPYDDGDNTYYISKPQDGRWEGLCIGHRYDRDADVCFAYLQQFIGMCLKPATIPIEIEKTPTERQMYRKVFLNKYAIPAWYKYLTRNNAPKPVYEIPGIGATVLLDKLIAEVRSQYETFQANQDHLRKGSSRETLGIEATVRLQRVYELAKKIEGML